jgi:hypothetical protein
MLQGGNGAELSGLLLLPADARGDGAEHNSRHAIADRRSTAMAADHDLGADDEHRRLTMDYLIVGAVCFAAGAVLWPRLWAWVQSVRLSK